MAFYVDLFNRADSTSTLGSHWTNGFNTMGINGNAAYGVTSSNTSYAYYNTALDTNDFQVDVILGTIQGSGADVWIVLGANTTGETAVGQFFNGSAPTIRTKTTWSAASTIRATASGNITLATGDVLSVRRVGNVYTAYQNGTAITGLSWTDSGDIVPRDSSHRLVGVGNFGGTNYRRIDTWRAFDTVDEGAPFLVASATAAIAATRSPSVTFSSYTPLENDVVVMFPSSTTTATITEPSGWVNPLGAGVDVESDAHQICCVYHLVTAAEESGSTTTYEATNLYDANETGDVVAAVVRKVDPASVVDDANSTFNSANTVTPHVLASLTGTNLSDDSLVLSSVAKDATGAYATQPSGWTFTATSNTNQGRALLNLIALTTSGSDVTATNITPSAGDEYASITVAFTKAPVTGPVTVTPGGASLTLTGAAASVVLGTVLAPADMALAVTGSAPTVTASDNITVTPTGAAVALTGSAPTVTATDNVRVEPGAASLALTGSAPTIVLPQLVTPSAATLTLTGSAPSITIGVNVAPGAATPTLTGSAPTVIATNHILLTPGGVSLTLTGSAPQLDSGIRPSAATLALSGSVPRLDSGIRPAGVAATLTGSAPQLHLSIPPGAGTLTLTGSAPTVTAGGSQTLQPGAATLTLTGSAPDVQAGGSISLSPGAATLGLTGSAPTVTATAHQTVQPGAATATLTGSAPTISVSQTVTPGAAAITLTGSTPTVMAPAIPAGATLTLMGFAPTVAITGSNPVLTPAAASLVLTTFIPPLRIRSFLPCVRRTETALAGAQNAGTVLAGVRRRGFDL